MVLPLASSWRYPGTLGEMPSTPGMVPKRLSKLWFCMTTTIRCLTGEFVPSGGGGGGGGGAEPTVMLTELLKVALVESKACTVSRCEPSAIARSVLTLVPET